MLHNCALSTIEIENKEKKQWLKDTKGQQTMRIIDLTGRNFGKLTVLERAENKWKLTAWLCKCECGNTCVVLSQNLRNGQTKSCGCGTIKHGKKGTRLYSIWQGMKARCNRRSHTWYKRYGGRGISICDEWVDDFQAFYNWAMANGYRDDLSIDRINNDGNYEPSNCKWSTEKEQKNNRSNVPLIEINGKSKTMSQWAEETNLKYQTVYHRYKRGVTGSDLIKGVRGVE